MSSFIGNFMHECKVLFQMKLLSFKSFSPVISSLLSFLENAASDVIDMALPRLQDSSRCLTKRSRSFACLEHVSWDVNFCGNGLMDPTANTVVPLLDFFYTSYWPKPLAASTVFILSFCLMLWKSSQTDDIPNETAGLGAKCWSAKEQKAVFFTTKALRLNSVCSSPCSFLLQVISSQACGFIKEIHLEKETAYLCLKVSFVLGCKVAVVQLDCFNCSCGCALVFLHSSVRPVSSRQDSFE